MEESSKKFIIKEATRKRCRIFELDEKTSRRFTPINLEHYPLLYEADNIDFCIYVNVDQEMIEFIKPKELSVELLEQIWKAILKYETDINVCLQKNDVSKFQAVIAKIRDKKISKVLETNPNLDRKTLELFSNLSRVSQMVVRGGLSKQVSEEIVSSTQYTIANLIDNDHAIGTLSRMITIDPSLYDHSASVAMFSGIIGKKALANPLSDDEAAVLMSCGIYHDTGKTGIPGSILNKPGKLSEDEFEIIKKHPMIGYEELVNAMNQGCSIHKLVPIVALEHHEKIGGGGYPDGKKGRLEENGNGIHLFSRITTIADVYSALLMERIYKPALTPEDAIKTLIKMGSQHFDVDILNPFIILITKSLNSMKSLSKEKGKIFYMDSDRSLLDQMKKHSKTN